MPADARAIAADALHAVLRRRRALDDALPGHAGFPELATRDRAFARSIAATALRRLGQIDDLLARCLDRPLPRRAAMVEDVLRSGAAQIVFLGAPAHAAVDRSVGLLRGAGQAGYKGLVNAVLRRIAAEGAAMAAGQDAPRLDTPDWLWRAWRRAFGEARCRRIAVSHLREAPLDITVRRDPAGWAAKLGAERLPTGTLRRAAGGRIDGLPGFAAGEWWVQDAAAAMPARLLMRGLAGGPSGRRVADLCAAPGGKTAQLAAAGAAVTALDRSAERLAMLEANLARLGLAAATVREEVESWRPERRFDAVLLDAPCTGTGTIRRHPDIQHLKTAADAARLARLQERLIEAAARLVAPGGLLVYSVCSLQPEEGPERIAAFIGGGAPFVRERVAPEEIGGIAEAVTPAGDLQTLPCHLAAAGGLDGFYAARLRRRP